jgi:hypothetical protein
MVRNFLFHFEARKDYALSQEGAGNTPAVTFYKMPSDDFNNIY